MKENNLKKIIAGIVATSVFLSTIAIDNNVYEASNLATIGTENGVFKLDKPNITNSTLPGRADVTLDWEDYTFKMGAETIGSNYVTVRRAVYYNEDKTTIKSYGEWDVRGKYGTTINVLNIYPNISGSNGFKSWMEAQSKYDNVDINVTSQSQSDFNQNTYRYLTKKADGSYNYDVIVFGFWDSYNSAKISSNALVAVQQFIDDGYGVLFGHDTVQTSAENVNKGFNDIVQKNLDIFLTPRNRPIWYVSDKIAVRKQGSLTTYPFDINGMDLTVPLTHTVAQLPGNYITGVPNNDIVFMTLEPNYYPSEGDGPYFHYNHLTSAKGPETIIPYKLGNNPTYNYIGNGYLIKQDNVAFIQSGHSNGNTSEAEQMVLANLMYSLAQISSESKGKDQILDDIEPSAPTDIDKNLIFDSKDYGVGYEYRIIATPIGFDLGSIDKQKLEHALNSNAKQYNDKVVFSNSYLTGEIIAKLKGSAGYESEKDQATYRYYINKNPNGTRIPTVEIPGKEDLTDDFFTLKYNESFNYKNHYTDVSKITDNDYLHIVAYDRANNVSAVSNLNLKSVLQKSDVTINSVYNNKIIKSKTELSANNPNLIVGTKYSPAIDKNIEIDGVSYVYSHTIPESKYITISANAKQNVITQVYDKLVSKDIYLVEIRPSINGEPATEESEIYMTETAEVGKNITVANNIPDGTSGNYTFKGWSKGSTTDYNNYSTDKEFTWTDDSDNIYLYYEKDVATVNIDIVRSDGKKFDTNVSNYTFTKQGYVGEKLTVTGTGIKSKLKVRNIDAFTNQKDLNNYSKTFTLSKKGEILKDKITLIPRTLNIKGIGINYGEVRNSSKQTSGSGVNIVIDEEKAISINKNLFSTIRTYDLEILVGEIAPAKILDLDGGADWKNYIDEENGQEVELDFSTTKDIQVAYYKGVKPEEAYTVQTNYLNILGNNEAIKPQRNSGTLNVVNSPNIPVSDELNITGIAGTTREVQFNIEHTEVIHNGNSKIYSSDIDLNEIIPYRDDKGTAEIGDYIVNVYYRPMAQVTYIENVYGVKGQNIVSKNITVYDVIYDDQEKTIEISHPIDEYNVEVSSNAQYSNGIVSAYVTGYDIEITTKYIPLVYNLKVEVIDNAELVAKTPLVYDFKNIPVKQSVAFNTPNYESSNYFFTEALIVSGGNQKDIALSDKSRIVFDPVVNPTISGTNYKMELHYDYLADIEGSYIVYRSKQKPLEGVLTANAFIGDVFTLNLPSAEGFVLTSAYLDGKEYTDVEAEGEYDILIENPIHYINLIYHELKYDLDAVAMTDGGTIHGGGSYYGDEVVYVTVEPEIGYKLEKITVEGADVELIEQEGTVGYYYFNMPKTNFTIQAYFTVDDSVTEVEDEDDSDYDDNTSSNIKDKVEVTKPDIIDTVKEPNNTDEKDIMDLVNDPYYSIVRQYISFMEGYPSGEIKPEAKITRGEAVKIIYNLYGNGYVSDKKSLERFSDINGDEWYADAVAFALDFGVINGYEDATFKANENITRAELSMIIAKFIQMDESVKKNINFTDLENNWAFESIMKLNSMGIIKGYEDNTFKQNGKTTRAEFITIVNRLINRPESYNTDRTFPDLLPEHWAYGFMMNAANGSVIDLELEESVIDKINEKK